MAKRKTTRRKKTDPKSATGPAQKPLSEIPDPPKYLVGEFAIEYWKRIAPLLVELKILTALDLESLTALCEAWQTYRSIGAELAADPSKRFFETEKGYQSISPLVSMRNQSLLALQKLWAKFGLTPDSLCKLGKHGGASDSDIKKGLAAFAAKKFE